MVIKVLKSTPTVMNPFRYNENKVAAGVARIIGVGNIKDTSYPNVYSALMDREEGNIRTEKPSLHIAFSPAVEDELEDEQVLSLIKDWMAKQGLGNQPYAVYKHNDILREHFHVVSTKLKEDGHSFPCHNIGWKSLRIMKELQPKYDYIIGPSKSAEIEMERFQFNYERGNIWKQIDCIYNFVLNSITYHSEAEFRTAMEACGLFVEIADSKNNAGKKTIIVRYKNKAGKIAGRPMYLSDEEYQMMNRQISSKKPKTDKLSATYRECLAGVHSIEDLEKRMKERNIVMRAFWTRDGGYQGLSFVDFNENTVVKASSLSSNDKDLVRETYVNGIVAAQTMMATQKRTKEAAALKALEKERQKKAWDYNYSLQEKLINKIVGATYATYKETKDRYNITNQEIAIKYAELKQACRESFDQKVAARNKAGNPMLIMVAAVITMNPILILVLALLGAIGEAVNQSANRMAQQEIDGRISGILQDIDKLKAIREDQKREKIDSLEAYLQKKEELAMISSGEQHIHEQITKTEAVKPASAKLISEMSLAEVDAELAIICAHTLGIAADAFNFNTTWSAGAPTTVIKVGDKIAELIDGSLQFIVGSAGESVPVPSKELPRITGLLQARLGLDPNNRWRRKTTTTRTITQPSKKIQKKM